MSLDYWSMKLNSCVVKHDGDYKTITNIFYRDSDERPHGGYPEEYLPYILFELDNETNADYDDFEIVFPDDQYIVVNDRLHYARRSASRHYKLAPSNSCYDLGGVNLKQLMNFNDNPVYSSSEDLFDLEKTDRVYSKDISSKQTTKTHYEILFKGKRVLLLKRLKASLKLSTSVKNVPTRVLDLFGEYIDFKVPFLNQEKMEHTPSNPNVIMMSCTSAQITGGGEHLSHGMEHNGTIYHYNTRGSSEHYIRLTNSGGYLSFNSGESLDQLYLSDLIPSDIHATLLSEIYINQGTLQS